MIKIYTKTGDSGESGLIGGYRAKKDETIFWVMGTLDELNALLGTSRSELNGIGETGHDTVLGAIERVQNDLFQIGSEIASLHQGVEPKTLVGPERVAEFENQIDSWSNILPELNNFIIPGGSRAGALLHQARTVCRRAERELVSLGKEKELRSELYSYLNRLGDWLFTAARYINRLSDEMERGLK